VQNHIGNILAAGCPRLHGEGDVQPKGGARPSWQKYYIFGAIAIRACCQDDVVKEKDERLSERLNH